MVSWSPPVAPFDYYRVSYRPTQGNEIVRFREEEWDLELGEGRCGESSTSQRLSPPPPPWHAPSEWAWGEEEQPANPALAKPSRKRR